MLQGLDLNGVSVAELASGNGANSLALLQRFPDVRVTGFDISPAACAAYAETVGRPAYEVDLTQPWTGPREKFDVALIVGGLHHCVRDIDCTLNNISELLKPGGLLLMCEPSSQFLFEGLRKIWYSKDRYFDSENEAAIEHDRLLANTGGAFEALSTTYFGGPAYFLIQNSMVLRVPLGLKRSLAAPLMLIESAYQKLPGRAPFAAFSARWRKT